MSIPKLEFPPFHLPAEAEALRGEVRSFLKEALPKVKTEDRFASWNTFSPEFSKALGKKGWIGITWPKQYGGSERSFLDRYVITEELLGNSAPAGAHWVADRQSGPLLLRFGSEEQRQAILPRITAGECYFSIGMSEPDSGSDLASVRTRAEPVPGGFRVNGTKVWTSGAHRNNYCIALVRTSGQHGDRHKGLSQLLVDLKTPGVTIRPIINLAGRHDWNEVTFNDAFIPESCLIGNEGDGWLQVTSELAFERSGPERFMQNFYILRELVRVLGRQPAKRAVVDPGSPDRPPVDAAPDVGRRRRHDAGRPVAGDRGGAGEGPRHDLPAGSARDRPCHRRVGRHDRGGPGRFPRRRAVRHHDGAELHHPGRHDPGSARHRRARAGAAMMSSPLRILVLPFAEFGEGEVPASSRAEGSEAARRILGVALPLRRRRRRHLPFAASAQGRG